MGHAAAAAIHSFIHSRLFVEETLQQKHGKDNSRQDKSGNAALTTALATRHSSSFLFYVSSCGLLTYLVF